MRIQSILKLHPLRSDLRPVSQRASRRLGDSIEMGRCPSMGLGRIRMIGRKFLDFLRRVFACCLPIKPYTPVSFSRVDYRRKEREGEIAYQILIDGIATNNQILYSKSGDAIALKHLDFPDRALRAHCSSILAKILNAEEARGFETGFFDVARLLYRSGYRAQGQTIHYRPEGKDSGDQLITDMIERARRANERGTLIEKARPALAAIEEALTARSMMDGFIDLAVSMHVVEKREPSAALSLDDLLQLMQALEIRPPQGAAFDTGRQRLAVFTASD